MKLNTEILGSAHKKTLTMLHGWGVSSKIFFPVADYLKDFYRIVLIDMPGYGINSKIPANRCDGIVGSLLETIPDDTALLGWSLGGILAQKFCIMHRQPISALITVSCSPRFLSDKNTGWPGIDPVILKKFSRVLTQANAGAVIDKFLSIQAMGSTRVREDLKVIRDLLASVPEPSYYELQAGLKTLLDEDLRDGIGGIECPSLHIYGRKDRLCPVSSSACWAGVKNSRTVIFENSSHAPFITETAAFNEEVRRFLDACP